MKLLIILLSLVFINALIYTPAHQRLRREINVLKNQYLSPQTKIDLSRPEKINESSVLSEVDYKNQKVPKLHYENKRDVAHLTGLLPASPEHKADLPPINVESPVASKLLPSNEYLPPVTFKKDTESFTEMTHTFTTMPHETQAGIEFEFTQPSNILLPPLAKTNMLNIATELPTIALKEYLPPQKTTEVILEAPLPTTLPKTNENIEIETQKPKQQNSEESFGEIVEVPMEMPRDFSTINVDTYYYQIPDYTSELLPTKAPFIQYLPPLEEGVIVAEGPANGDSSVLENDGYHYRTIKRRF